MSKWIKPWYRNLFHNQLLWYFYTLLFLLFKFDFRIFLVKRFFRWLRVDEINSLSIDYYNRYEKKIFPSMFSLINSEKKKSKVILLSASINQPIDYLKNKFWIEWFSSILEEKAWIYTWKVIQSLRWNKESIFIEWKFSLNNYDSICFYTDNLDDVWLINYLNNHHKDINICIIPYKNKKYWKRFFNSNNINYEFLD